MKERLTYLAIIFFAVVSLQIKASVRANVANGNWSNPGTWGGNVPGVNDDVIIIQGTIVNLNQTTVNAIGSLTLQAGAVLKVSVNGAGLHIRGSIGNLGELSLWNSNAQKGTLFLHGNSYLSGAGIWNFGMIQLGDYGLEFDDFLLISIADNIAGNALSTINSVNKRIHTVLNFNGTENSTLPSSGGNYYYPSVRIGKTALDSRTVAFNDQSEENKLNIMGALNIVGITDRLGIGSNNELELVSTISGQGTISGGHDAKLRVAGNLHTVDTLRVTNGSSFYNFALSRPAGVVLQNSFVIRNRLTVEPECGLTLPSNATLTLGVNGSTPSKGEMDCKGYLFAGSSSALTIRGDGPVPVELKFSQEQAVDHTLSGLTISRTRNAGEVRLHKGASLILSGPLEIDTANSLNIADGNIYLNLTISVRPEAYFTGTELSGLYIQGTGGNATLRFNQNGPIANRTFRILQLERSSGRVITLADQVCIRERVNVISGKLNSDGNLTLLSDQTGSAAIDYLALNADIVGDVVVNSFFTGGAGMRGTRMVSSPIDDTGTVKSLYKQLQEHMFITGTGGATNGFDLGGNTQPYAATIQVYNERATAAQPQFSPLPVIHSSAVASDFPGKGKGFFLFFRGDRSGPAKLAPLNGSYATPEGVTVAYTGPVNKRDISVALSFTDNPGDQYNGYNVLGNPYPACIDWRKVEKINMLDVVSIIRPGGGMATYSNGITINGQGLPVIQAGQAFYVRAAGNGASVKFTEDCKSLTQAPARLLSANEKDRKIAWSFGAVNAARSRADQLSVRIRNSEGSEETVVAIKDESSEFFDEFDAPYFPGSATAILTESKEGTGLAINFIPAPGDSTVIRLNFLSDTIESQLSFPQLPGRNYRLRLHDSWLGKSVVISDSTEYHFKTDARQPLSFGKKRFTIVIERSITERQYRQYLEIFPVPVHDKINFSWQGGRVENARVLIFDSSGRKVRELTDNDLSNLAPGIYIAEVSTLSGKLIGRRKFIKKE